MVKNTIGKILVFQHIRVEHPGIFRTFLNESGIEWDVVELDEGDTIPDLGAYDALWVMGGPMDVWQKAENPWLVDEIAAIREAVVERHMPYLGLCLGHQLLAEAAGGEVGPSKTPEIGVMNVDLTRDGVNSPFMEQLPRTLACLQWHSAEVVNLPAEARCLMASAQCRYQAMSIGDTALSLQFHVEIEADTVATWSRIPEYADALTKSLGPDGLSSIDSGTKEQMHNMNTAARKLYDNWIMNVTK